MGMASTINYEGRPRRKSYLGLTTFLSLLILSVLLLTTYQVRMPFLATRRDTSSAQSRGSATGDGDKYLVGAGRADITGPVVEINMAGYADLSQCGSGLRQRLYS